MEALRVQVPLILAWAMRCVLRRFCSTLSADDRIFIAYIRARVKHLSA
jgi:hypothetical protein